MMRLGVLKLLRRHLRCRIRRQLSTRMSWTAIRFSRIIQWTGCHSLRATLAGSRAIASAVTGSLHFLHEM